MTFLPDLGLDKVQWYVAHTKPRCEKKLVDHCERESLEVNLPCYSSTRRYASKTVTFLKPIFPNYVFLRLRPTDKPVIFKSHLIHQILDVPDQELFKKQLQEILDALATGEEIYPVHRLVEGTRVRITKGPLKGIEGCVEKRFGIVEVILRLDFISQAAAVKVHATELEVMR